MGSKSDTDKVHNHYVPKVYMKQWAIKNKINTYEVLVPNKGCPIWKTESIKRTSSEDYFYLYIANEQLSVELEEFFSKEIEDHYPAFIEKIDSYKQLSVNDYIYISKLVASQYVRTIGGYIRCKEIIKNSSEDIMEETVTKLNEKVRNKEKLEYSNLEENEFIPLKLEIKKEDESNTYLKIESIVGKSIWLFYMKHLLGKTYSVLNNISWCIYDAPDNFEWITSDDPVIFLNYYEDGSYDFKGGWGKENTNVIFPLTPKKLLFAQIGMKQEFLYKKANISFAMDIQKYIAEHAVLKIYASNGVPYISSLRKRVVNRQEYLRIKNEVKSFHKNYMEEEVPLLKNFAHE